MRRKERSLDYQRRILVRGPGELQSWESFEWKKLPRHIKESLAMQIFKKTEKTGLALM